MIAVLAGGSDVVVFSFPAWAEITRQGRTTLPWRMGLLTQAGSTC